MMTEAKPTKEEQLFIYLVGTFQSSAWVALGRMKNPITNRKERKLKQASFYIDLLDMMQNKMKDNLSEYEEQVLINAVSELKLNFIEEQKKADEQEKNEHRYNTSDNPSSEEE
tara:strand:+ start:8619 stop:8957 length:339 start_codon:yes stop_codon:yes gene_type:complete